MDRTVAALTRHYPRRDEAAQQALAVLNQYPSLVNPEQSDFTYDDGRVELLLSLTGVLPVPIGSNTYHCPVAIWLPLDFPSKPPIVYVLPSETLQIRKGKHVDANGKVAVPYLDNWERKSEGCSLTSLVHELIPVFSARYPLSPVQAKPKPPAGTPSSSPAGPPPPRPDPRHASQAMQPAPPRPALPPSVSPSGSGSFSSGPPPRPPLPTQSATMGPGVPSRPQSMMMLGEPARSASLSLDGRTGSPVAPLRPPPPRTEGQLADGMPPSSPPPPAYPTQPPLAPPIPPPQRPVSGTYTSAPPFDPSRNEVSPPGQLQPSVAGQPTLPAPPSGWQTSHDPRTSTFSTLPPMAAPVHFSATGPPPPTHSSVSSTSYPAPVPVPGRENSAGIATGPVPPPAGGMAPYDDLRSAQIGPPIAPEGRVASPAQTILSEPRVVDGAVPPHHRSSRQEDRRTSMGPVQSFRSATPPQHAFGPHGLSQTGGVRSYSPAPSETGTAYSYASSAPMPPQSFRTAPPHPSHARMPSSQAYGNHGPPQPPTPRSPPPPTHTASSRTTHLMYDRAQTHSPVPLSDVGSYASSRTQEYGNVDRSRGPRAPGPPSEYSATGEYGSYNPSDSMSTVGGQTHAAPTPPPVPRDPPARSMTVSYETRQPRGPHPEGDSDPAFEPVIEARSPPTPPQPPQPPELPPPTPTRSDYTATSSAFVPQRQFTQPADGAVPYQGGYSRPAPVDPGPPGPASVASYASSVPYGYPGRDVGPQSYGHAGANGYAPPIPIVAASPPAVRAAKKGRPASSAPKPVNILDAADDDDLDSGIPSSPSTVTDPHLAASVRGSDSISNAGGAAAQQSQQPPPVPPNPALLALRTRVHSKLTTALTHLAHSTEAELARLDLMRVDLEKAQPAIEDEMARLEAVRSVCHGVRDRYAQVVSEAQQRMREYEARGDGVDVDEIVCGSTVVYTQLLDLVAEDAALEDTIYALGRGLNSGGTANIDLDRFLKRVRALAKEQFVVRATINKILAGLAERRNARESQQQQLAGGGSEGWPVASPNGGGGGGVYDHGSGRGGRGTPASAA
ncbi:hypothetical protein JCM3774_000953 [Rhodotorula dairenensis]